MNLTLPAEPANAVRVRPERYDSPALRPFRWHDVSPHFVSWFVAEGFGFHQWNTILRDARVEGADNPETFQWPFKEAA